MIIFIMCYTIRIVRHYSAIHSVAILRKRRFSLYVIINKKERHIVCHFHMQGSDIICNGLRKTAVW